jgi:DNA-binding transcriptional MocR family regulator
MLGGLVTEPNSDGVLERAVPFIYGHVDPTRFPVDQLISAATETLTYHSQQALNYGPAMGPEPLRGYLREKMAREEELVLAPEEIAITAGASAGLDTAVRIFTEPGDVVLVEAPSYHEAVLLIRDYPVKVAAVPLDEEGLSMEALAARLESLTRAGERPALVYTIPTFQNPSGVTMSPERRRAVLELAYQFDLLVIEDDVYRDLSYDEPPPPSLLQLDEERQRVIRLGSLSKILAPGLRLGWATGPAPLVERMATCGLMTSGGGANPLAAYVVARFCTEGYLEPHILRLRQNYAERRDVLLGALKEHMPSGIRWTEPRGGFFVWVTLPQPLTARVLLAEAAKERITFVPGDAFYAEGGGEHHLRLAFSKIERAEMARGVAVMGDLIRELL